jgi:hypothetical protein
MLRPLALADDFDRLEQSLQPGWGEARLQLTVADDARCDRAAALLGPANPGRRGKTIRFSVAGRGPGLTPDAIRRLLRRLDAERIAGHLELAGVANAGAAPDARRRHPLLRMQWEEALATLPSDWTDIYAEVRFTSTDYVERAALLLAPCNPARYGGANALRFRCACHFGYGVSPEMAGRCLQRCDEEGITGEVEILRALSDTYPVTTQGPVWYVGGRAV